MPEGRHKQIPIQVTVDVDEGIADLVLYLNTIPGVRTLASCQGTIGEGGPNPYPPQVMVTWADASTFAVLERDFDLTEISAEGSWAYLHPRGTRALALILAEIERLDRAALATPHKEGT